MTVRTITGDCRLVMPTLPAGSAQMCVTSPPYWGLRDYGVPHGQLGLEDDPRDYIASIVEVFRGVARILRDDGTLWLNMGDAYTDGGRGADVGSTLQGTRHNQAESRKNVIRERAKPFGLGRKQLLGMPWRVAFALQDDGWTLRSDIVWHKPNPMPESATDRPTKAHEYFFLFSKQRFYYYDQHAIAERASSTSHDRGGGVGPKAKIPSGWDTTPGGNHHEALGRYSEGRKNRAQSRLRGKQNASYSAAITALVAMRNSRDVWRIPTAPYKGAHFATFPPALAERAILAGSSPHACCRCGTAYERVVGDAERAAGKGSGNRERKYRGDHGGNQQSLTRSHQGHAIPWEPSARATLGWTAGCECVPPVVGRSTILDPFGGAGTVGLVGERLGRDSILIELSPSYSQMSRDRINDDAPLLSELEGA